MSGRKTIDDVALLAGVSNATVSRVLNNNTPVSAAKRERVLSAVKTLRFRPNTQARLLAGRRPNTVLLVHPVAHHDLTWYFHMLEGGALRGCTQLGFSLQTHMVRADSARRLSKILEPINRRECDGVLLSAPFSDDPDIIRALQAREVPLVLLASGVETRAMAAGVGMDDEAAGVELMTYLLRLGHKRFAFSLGLSEHKSALSRFVGARWALEKAGLASDCVVEVQGGLDFPGGFEACQRVIATGFRPTAMVCANDESAAGAIHAARGRKLSLPDDLTIVGFDDAPFAQLLSPPLTTVAQPIDVMAARAVDILAEIMRGGVPDYETVKPRLVVRESASAA